jgi:hypothetical protein
VRTQDLSTRKESEDNMEDSNVKTIAMPIPMTQAPAPEAVIASAPEAVTSAPEAVASAPDRALSSSTPKEIRSLRRSELRPHVSTRPDSFRGSKYLIYAQPTKKDEDEEMMNFLLKVCIDLRMDSTTQTKWILAVNAKFVSMKLKTVNGVMKNIMKINRMLDDVYHHTPMKWETLDAMAQVATAIMNHRLSYSQERCS